MPARHLLSWIIYYCWKIRKIKIRNSLPDPVNSFNSNDKNLSSFHFQKQIYDFYLLMNWSVSSVILSPSYFSSPYFGLGIFELGGLVEQFEFVASKTLLKVSGQDLTSSVIIEVSCWIIWKCNFWKNTFAHKKKLICKQIQD